MDQNGGSSAQKRFASIQSIYTIALIAAVLFALVATITLARLFNERNNMEDSHLQYERCNEAAQDLMVASDYLTTEARLYVLTGDEAYMNKYLDEVLYDKNRDYAIKTIHAFLEDNQSARERLDKAFSRSNDLAEHELYAMKLVALANNLEQLPQELADVDMLEQDAQLEPDQKRELARTLVLGEQYQKDKNLIAQSVNECTSELIVSLQDQEELSSTKIDALLAVLLVIVILLVVIVAAAFVANYVFVIKPLREQVQAAGSTRDEP